MILSIVSFVSFGRSGTKEYLPLQLINNKRLNIINNKFLIANRRTRGIFSHRLIHDLLSQLIKFNKEIFNEKQGNSVKIMGGFVWPTRLFPSV